MDKRVLDAMIPFLVNNFGNPSSLHTFGTLAKESLAHFRSIIAECINAETNEIITLAALKAITMH